MARQLHFCFLVSIAEVTIPVISDLVPDAKADVSQDANATLLVLCVFFDSM